MGVRNWLRGRWQERKYPDELSLLGGVHAEMSKPGLWPHDHTLIAYWTKPGSLIDSDVYIGSPDDAEYQSEPPSGAMWATAFWQGQGLETVFLIDRAGNMSTLIVTEDRFHYGIHVQHPLIDDMFGNFKEIFTCSLPS